MVQLTAEKLKGNEGANEWVGPAIGKHECAD
jgi:hypothetical protein